MNTPALIVLLALLIVLLVLAGKKKIKQLDLALLVIGIVALTWKSFSQLQHESFVDSTSMLKNEEDISNIQENLLLYYTVFNSKSYTRGSSEWKSIVNSKQYGKELRVPGVSSFERAKGLPLSTYPITGPMSSRLNISYNSPYTMAFVFRHGNLQGASATTATTASPTSNNKISMLKLYANSPNNNGIELYIERDTLKTVNNVQFGKMMFQFANFEPIACKLSPTDDFISIADNTLCFVYIVRSDSNIRVMYSTATDPSIREVAKFNVPNNDITFSNKELVINQSQNWNASVYNLAVYSGAQDEAMMSTFGTHIKSLYTKVSDPNYGAMMKQYNRTMNKLSSMQRCTMSRSVCKKCRGIKEWNNITQIMNGSKECTSAISNYCAKNPSHRMCECWDESSAVYSSRGCGTLRSTLSNDPSTCLASLTPKEVKKLVAKHATSAGAGAGAGVQTRKEKKSSLVFDDNYTFDMVRVNYGEPTTTPMAPGAPGAQGSIPVDPATMRMYQDNNTISRRLLSFFGY